MRVAVFSDVHANLIALERFVQATRGSVDAYLCLGDVVDYGPWNDECLELIHQLPNVTILKGNHEDLFQGTTDIGMEPPLVQEYFHSSIQSFSRLDLIKDLPEEACLGTFKCAHTLNGRSVYANTAIDVESNYIIGHTHHQFQIERSGFWVINPGSVGQNRKWIDVINYGIFATDTSAMEMYSIRYDVGLFISELRRRRYPEPCVQYYANKPRLHE